MIHSQDDIEIKPSNGMGQYGTSYYYIRPVAKCFNRSRKVSESRIESIIQKWFAPRVILYSIDGRIIGSNNKENALKEYWRVCEGYKINREFSVKQIT